MKLTKQNLLESLKNYYLQILAEVFKVNADKRINSEMVQSLNRDKQISLKDILNQMTVRYLQNGCKYYGIKPKSHRKADLVKSLLTEPIHSPHWPITNQGMYVKDPKTGKRLPVAYERTPFAAPNKVQKSEQSHGLHKEFSIDEAEDDYQGDEEGRQRLGWHLSRERSSSLRNKFKKALESIQCCVCGFDFESTYGSIGADFIEVHHRTPLSQLKPGKKVTLEDLEAVCSNCHRMLHRKSNMNLTSEDLRRIIHKDK